MSLQESLRLSQAESQGRAERIESLENDVSELEAKARAHETERRRLHNTIQELKVLTIAYSTAYAVHFEYPILTLEINTTQCFHLSNIKMLTCVSIIGACGSMEVGYATSPYKVRTMASAIY